MKISEQMNTEGLTFLGLPLEEHERLFWEGAKKGEEGIRISKETVQNGIEQAGIDYNDLTTALPFDRLCIIANDTVLDSIDDECPLLYNRIFDAFLAGAPYTALKRAARLLSDEIDELEKSAAERGCEPAELEEAYLKL